MTRPFDPTGRAPNTGTHQGAYWYGTDSGDFLGRHAHAVPRRLLAFMPPGNVFNGVCARFATAEQAVEALREACRLDTEAVTGPAAVGPEGA